jgi:hypothetical protein
MEMKMNETTPPDIKELREAEKKIDEVTILLGKVDDALDDLRDLGPREVLAPAATHYKNLVDLENLIEAMRLKVYHIKNGYQFHVMPPLFHDASVDTVKTLNGYTVNISDDVSVSIPADRKGDAYDWLDKNGYGDIIQSTVNSSTLKATVKGMYKDGVVVPEDVFKVTTLKKYRVYQSSRKLPEAAGGG